MSVRFTQLVVETLRRPSATNVRFTQLSLEALQRPTAARTRMSQIAVEVISHNGASGASVGTGMLIIAT